MKPRIQVTHDYAGKETTRYVRIPVGVYEVGDPNLFGLEDYLVHEQGRAFYLDPLPEDATEPEVVTVATVDYSDWTVSALKDELEARGIDIDQLEGSGAGGKLLKDDLVTVLEGDDADAREPQNETIEFNGRTIDAQAPEAD